MAGRRSRPPKRYKSALRLWIEDMILYLFMALVIVGAIVALIAFVLLLTGFTIPLPLLF